MTRKEIVELLRMQESEGNVQVISLIKMIDLYLPFFLAHPDAATFQEIKRYNSLVRSNIEEKRLQDILIITK